GERKVPKGGVPPHRETEEDRPASQTKPPATGPTSSHRRAAMKEFVFALEFRGSAAPVSGSDKKLQAKTSATSQILRCLLKADGIQGSVETASGGSASFEAAVDVLGQRMFI